MDIITTTSDGYHYLIFNIITNINFIDIEIALLQYIH